MTWDTSRMAGPQPIPVFGDPAIDPISGQLVPTVEGYQGVAFVFPAKALPPGLESSAVPVPEGVSELAGAACKALVYADEDAAKGPLAGYLV